MPWHSTNLSGDTLSARMIGAVGLRAANAASAGLRNSIGSQPPFGANESGLDSGGGAPTGGFDPSPSTGRSGIAGRGRNQAESCMTSAELNGCYAPGPAKPGPGDPHQFCWRCIAGQMTKVFL